MIFPWRIDGTVVYLHKWLIFNGFSCSSKYTGPMDGKGFEIWKRESGSDLMKQRNSPQIPAWHQQLWYLRIRIPLWCSDQILWLLWKYIVSFPACQGLFWEYTPTNQPLYDSSNGKWTICRCISYKKNGGAFIAMGRVYRTWWTCQVNGNTDSLAAECRKQQELRISVYRAANAWETAWDLPGTASTGHPRLNFHFWQILTLKNVFFF